MKPIIPLLIFTLFSCNSNIERDTEDVQASHTSKGEIVKRDIQNGDIIFQISMSSQSQAIQAATHSDYSHMGIIYDVKGQKLVWKIYKEGANIEIGKLEKLSDFDLKSKIVQQKMKERYGDNFPMNEQVISPAEMFDSDRLEMVMKE